MMRLFLLAVVGLSLALTSPALSQSTFSAPIVAPGAKAEARQWEDEIARFEAADRSLPPPTGGVLFVGSSSIALWPSLGADFPLVDVVKRGFGGSQLADVLYFAPRIVLPYRPRTIVLYAGENDLQSGRPPDAVFADFKAFVALVRSALPETKIAFISIKPSEARLSLMERIREANEMIRQYAGTQPGLIYVDVFTPMLREDGLPRNELFIEDRLHLNAKGYALWRHRLSDVVVKRLRKN